MTLIGKVVWRRNKVGTGSRIILEKQLEKSVFIFIFV